MPSHNPLINRVEYTPMAASVSSAQGAPSAAFDGARGSVIDGTPIRVVTLAFAAAAGLTVLKWSGVRFNVGIS